MFELGHYSSDPDRYCRERAGEGVSPGRHALAQAAHRAKTRALAEDADRARRQARLSGAIHAVLHRLAGLLPWRASLPAPDGTRGGNGRT